MLRLLTVFSVAVVATAANASIITYTATLDGLSESPPNASPGTATATVTVDTVLHTMRVEASFAGLLGTTTACHIHVINGPGDANMADTLGPVATTTPTFAGFPNGVTSGMYDNTLDLTASSSYRGGWITDSGGIAGAETQLLAGIADGRAYLNIHTSVFGGGEIRGFLQPVPEPATFSLLALAATVGLMRRRG